MDYGTLLAGISASILIYGPLVILDPKLEWDDTTYLAWLARIPDLKTYFGKLLRMELLDFYPVRDLSWLLDREIFQRTGVSTYHLGNLLIWIGILCLVHRLAHRILSAPSARVVTLLYAVHPVTVGSVAWLSARKHLLACFFIFWATHELLSLSAASVADSGSRPKSLPLIRLRLTLAYLLSAFSVPIAGLWPVWSVAWYRHNNKHSDGDPATSRAATLEAFIPLAIAFAFVLVVFAVYCRLPGVVTGESPSLPVSLPAKLLDLVRTQGRQLFNIVQPYRLSLHYAADSPWNSVGIGFLAALAGIAFRLRARKDALLWLGYYFFPSLILIGFAFVHGRPREDTLRYLSDSYSLIPLFGILCFALLAFETLSPRSPLAMRPRLGVLLTLLLALAWGRESSQLVELWKTEEALWRNTAVREDTLFSRTKVAALLTRQGRTRESLEELESVRARDPGYYWLPLTYSEAVRSDKTLSLAAKIGLLEKLRSELGSRDPWLLQELARLYAESGEFGYAFTMQRDAFSATNAYGEAREWIAAEIVTFCQGAGGSDCERIKAEALQADPHRTWNEERYQQRIRDLKPLLAEHRP